MFDNDRALLSLLFGSASVGSFANLGEGPGPGEVAGCWCGCGGRGATLGAESFGSMLVLVCEDLNIVGGRKVCMLMRDRRLVGPEELLDLVLWDDRDCMSACRSASSLESAGGESSRFLRPMSYNRDVALSRLVGSFEKLTRRGTFAFHAD